MLDESGQGFKCVIEGKTEKQAFNKAMRKGAKLMNQYLKQCEFIEENY